MDYSRVWKKIVDKQVFFYFDGFFYFLKKIDQIKHLSISIIISLIYNLKY